MFLYLSTLTLTQTLGNPDDSDALFLKKVKLTNAEDYLVKAEWVTHPPGHRVIDRHHSKTYQVLARYRMGCVRPAQD